MEHDDELRDVYSFKHRLFCVALLDFSKHEHQYTLSFHPYCANLSFSYISSRRSLSFQLYITSVTHVCLCMYAFVCKAQLWDTLFIYCNYAILSIATCALFYFCQNNDCSFLKNSGARAGI